MLEPSDIKGWLTKKKLLLVIPLPKDGWLIGEGAAASNGNTSGPTARAPSWSLDSERRAWRAGLLGNVHDLTR